MQAVVFRTIVITAQAGVGVVHGPHANFLAIEAHAKTQAVFKLEGRAEVVVLQLGIGEKRDANASFNIGLDRLASNFLQ